MSVINRTGFDLTKQLTFEKTLNACDVLHDSSEPEGRVGELGCIL